MQTCQRLALKMMYLSVLKSPNIPSKWKSWKDELKRSQVNVAIMQQKNVIQPSLRLQNDDTSSMANRRPPTGAANAADTPAAAPAVVKFRLHHSLRLKIAYSFFYKKNPLQNYEVSYSDMGSHSITYHPTQIKAYT